MENGNIPVNGRLYEIIVKGLCDDGRPKEAYMHLNEMIKNGHLISFRRWKTLFYSTFVGNKTMVPHLDSEFGRQRPPFVWVQSIWVIENLTFMDALAGFSSSTMVMNPAPCRLFIQITLRQGMLAVRCR